MRLRIIASSLARGSHAESEPTVARDPTRHTSTSVRSEGTVAYIHSSKIRKNPPGVMLPQPDVALAGSSISDDTSRGLETIDRFTRFRGTVGSGRPAERLGAETVPFRMQRVGVRSRMVLGVPRAPEPLAMRRLLRCSAIRAGRLDCGPARQADRFYDEYGAGRMGEDVLCHRTEQ